MTTTVYLVDDHALFRTALAALVERIEGFSVVGHSGDGRAAIEEIARLCPDLVLLDITMEGFSGLDALEHVRRRSPGTLVLMTSQHEGSSLVRQALRAGAHGYLCKSGDPQELRLALRASRKGERYVSPRVATSLLGEDAMDPDAAGSRLAVLTPREREVLQLIAVGKANKEIAAVLHLSVGTVRKHRENLQRKLDCRSAAEIARLAIREGLLAP